MNKDIIRGFIEDVMEACMDGEVESNEIPAVMVKMLLEIGDDGDVKRLIEDCNIDPYGNAINQLEVYEVVYNDISIHFESELANVTYKYQDAGCSHKEAEGRALNTLYIKQIGSIVKVLDSIIKELKED